MKIFWILNILACLNASIIFACPTCVGKIKPESPLFFSDEFYKPTNGHSVSRATKEQVGADEFKKLIESKRGKK